MSGALQAVFQNQRSFGTPPGSQSFTTSGVYSWVAPAGVTSVSVVAIGAGGSGRYTGCPCVRPQGTWWGGGALAWRNNVTVIPGCSYSVTVGAAVATYPGQSTCSAVSSNTIANGGGTGTQGESCFTGQGGGKGGKKGNNGGGGAGGYSGQGGLGGDSCANGNAGVGGAGGGGGGGKVCNDFTCRQRYWGAGGGVGLLGSGSNGAAGSGGGSTGGGGGGGSGGSAAGTTSTYLSIATGGAYGGGSGNSYRQSAYCACCGYTSAIYYGGVGGGGAYRIVWPGCSRSFPSTCVGSP